LLLLLYLSAILRSRSTTLRYSSNAPFSPGAWSVNLLRSFAVDFEAIDHVFDILGGAGHLSNFLLLGGRSDVSLNRHDTVVDIKVDIAILQRDRSSPSH
jgi:hypothetical protein